MARATHRDLSIMDLLRHIAYAVHVFYMTTCAMRKVTVVYVLCSNPAVEVCFVLIMRGM